MAPVHEESLAEDAATRTAVPDESLRTSRATARIEGYEDPATRDARRRVLWRESPEYRSVDKWRLPALAISFGLAALVGLLWFSTPTFSGLDVPQTTYTLIGGYATFFAMALPAYFWLARQWMARRAFEDRLTLGLVSELQDQEQQLAEGEGKTDLASLWAVTQKRIDLYHGIATSQAENSFRVGQVAAVAGFVAVLSLGFIAAFATSGTGAIAASVIGVAGAAMSGYIGATFLKAQADASAQLRQFFLQPVEFSRMLAVERLIADLPDNLRAEAVQTVVQAMMAGRADKS